MQRVIFVLILLSFVGCRSFISKSEKTAEHRALYVMIEFKDRKFPETRTIAHYQKLLFGNKGSVRDYFKEVSYGKLELAGQVIKAKLDMSIKSLVYREFSQKSSARLATQLEKVLKQAAKQIDLGQFDLLDTEFRPRPDGYIDHIGFIVPATAQEVWSHYNRESAEIRVGNLKVADFMLLNTTEPMGLFAHEFGHSLGLPDLYDSKRFKYGVGPYSLMATGSRLDDGDTPSHISAWGKAELGWLRPLLVDAATLSSQSYILQSANRKPMALRLQLPAGLKHDYLLIEYRTRVGYDSDLPAGYVLIYAVKEYAQTVDTVEVLQGGALGATGKKFLYKLKKKKLEVRINKKEKQSATIAVTLN